MIRFRKTVVPVAAATVLALAGPAMDGFATAQTSSSTPAPAGPQSSPVADLIAEAARRFALPEAWIRSVMRAESAFDPRATSHAGAMGLMQMMPATYAELRARHGLGPDPYEPRDNVLAGAAYLRELHDAFGSPGFLAAYNAGPGRYREHLTTGRPLPLETRQYVAKITAWLTPDTLGPARAPLVLHPWSAPAADPATAAIFVDLGVGVGGAATGSGLPTRQDLDSLFSSALVPMEGP